MPTKHRAMGSDAFKSTPLRYVATDDQQAARTGKKPSPPAKGGRVQFNAQFPSHEWPDWIRAAADVLDLDQRDVIIAAVEAYQRHLPPAQRKDIDRRAQAYAEARNVLADAPGRR